MKGWALKRAVIESTKSGMVKGWAQGFNQSIPCSIQLALAKAYLKPGHVWARFHGPLRTKFYLQIPIDSIMFEHKLLRHSIPFKHYEDIRRIAHDLTLEAEK